MVMSLCDRCGNSYFPEKSTAELRLTYCCLMCEAQDHVLISTLLQARRSAEGEAMARIWRRLQEESESLKEAAQ